MSTSALTRSGPIVPDRAVLPTQLVTANCWMVWQYQHRAGEDAPRKVPYYTDGGLRGKGMTLDCPEDVSRLASFDMAVRCAEAPSSKYSGVGVALRAELNIGGIDLDDCLDDAGLVVSDIAQQVLSVAERSGCYCERSPSGTGLRIIGHTQGFKGFNRGGHEAYCKGRYLTITGDCVANPLGFGSIDQAVKVLSDLTQKSPVVPQNLPQHLSELGTNIPSTGYVAPDLVQEGGRNDAVLKYVGHVRGIGMPEALIEIAALDFNKARCVPPLTDEEVTDIVSRYAKGSTMIAPEGWPEPEPIEFALPPVKPFDFEMLPDAFRGYVTDVADLMQAPPDYVAVSLMIAAAAVLGNNWAIAPKAKDESWLVTPVLWGGIVGRPSSKKSPALSQGLAFLNEVEANIAAGYQLRLQRYNAEKIEYEEAEHRARKTIRSGGKIEMLPAEPIRPEPERLVVNDATVQKVADIHRSSPRGLLLVKDELVGHLETLRQDGQESARAFYLEAWNGTNSYKIDRIIRGSSEIQRLAVWILGGIQPSKLDEYVRQATLGGASDDGLLQRFQLIVWPDASSDWKIVDRRANKKAAKIAARALVSLRTLDPKVAGATSEGEQNPAFLHFTTDAQTHYNAYWERMELSIRGDKMHPALESHFAKYPRLLAALALVIHLVDGGTGPVTSSAVQRAWRWIVYLKTHAKRVYASVTNPAAASAHALAAKIASGKLNSGFSAREVERKGWAKLSTGQEVHSAIAWLIDANWLMAVQERTATITKTTYLINPRLVTATI